LGAGDLGDEELRNTLLELRAMRLAACVLIGSGLAVSGVIMQGLFRNPLADPGVIGASAGSLFGGMVAVFLAYFFAHIPAIVVLPLGCIAGGLLTLYLILLASGRSGDHLTVLLTGVALGMFFASLGAALSAWAQRDFELARSLMVFAFGSVDAKGMEHLLLATPLVFGAIFAAWRWSNALDLLLSGEEEAASLGVDLHKTRRWLIVWATLPVAGAVAIGGNVAFVGLVVPHLLRGFIGPQHRLLIPCSALGGGLFVLACDILSRILPTEGEMPIGVISGLVGAPIFLHLLFRTREEALA
jgi:iron complex transport system permease protein